MAALRGGDDALRACKQHTCCKGILLLDVHGLHEAVLHELGKDNACSVVPETACVDGCGLEGMAKGVHGEEGSHAGLVAKVVLELTPGELGAGVRFGRNEAGLLAFLDIVAHERICNSGEV